MSWARLGLLAVLVLALGTPAHSQTAAAASPEAEKVPTLVECDLIKDSDAEQLKCFRAFAKPEIEKQKKEYAKKEEEAKKDTERFVRKWKVRDTTTVTPAGDIDIGSKSGTFQIGTSGGQSTSVAKVSALGILQPINGGILDTWEPFFGASWDRDTTAKTPKDQRQFLVGISGGLFNIGNDGSQVFSTLRVGRRNDIRADTESGFVNLHADIYLLPWIRGKQGESTTYSGTYLTSGVLIQDSKSAIPNPALDGRRTGIYAGVKWEGQLNALLPRFTVSASTQTFRDIEVSAMNQKT